LGNQPALPSVQGFDDLVAMVLAEMTKPCDLIAQSLGGVVAVKAALARPDRVRRLVLAVTSGGVPVRALGGGDWRKDYFRSFPNAARWIGELSEDLSDQLQGVMAPTLLLWGDSDSISPVDVGRLLKTLLPNAELRIVSGADHDLARTHPQIVAELIERHLGEK
jgi:pimeloyl-ACP methyl ester carboxylesterase